MALSRTWCQRRVRSRAASEAPEWAAEKTKSLGRGGGVAFAAADSCASSRRVASTPRARAVIETRRTPRIFVASRRRPGGGGGPFDANAWSGEVDGRRPQRADLAAGRRRRRPGANRAARRGRLHSSGISRPSSTAPISTSLAPRGSDHAQAESRRHPPLVDQCHGSSGRFERPNRPALAASHRNPGLLLDVISAPLC